MSLQMRTDATGMITHTLNATSLSLRTWGEGLALPVDAPGSNVHGSMTGALSSYLREFSAGGAGQAIICPPRDHQVRRSRMGTGRSGIEDHSGEEVRRLLPSPSNRVQHGSECGRQLCQLLGGPVSIVKNTSISPAARGATSRLSSDQSTSASADVYAVVLRAASTPSRFPLLDVAPACSAYSTALVVVPHAALTPKVCKAAALNTSVHSMSMSKFLAAVKTGECPLLAGLGSCMDSSAEGATDPSSRALTVAVCSALSMRVRSFVSTYHPGANHLQAHALVPGTQGALNGQSEGVTFPTTVRSLALATASIYAIAMRALSKSSQIPHRLNVSSRIVVPASASNVSQGKAGPNAVTTKGASRNRTAFHESFRSVAMARASFYANGLLRVWSKPLGAQHSNFVPSEEPSVETMAVQPISADSVALVPADFYAGATTSRPAVAASKSGSRAVASPMATFYEVALRAMAKPSSKLLVAPALMRVEFPPSFPLLSAPSAPAVAEALNSPVSDMPVLSMGAQAVLSAVHSYASTIATFAKSSLCPPWMEPTPTPSPKPTSMTSTNSTSSRAAKSVHSLMDTVLLARSRTPLGEQFARS